MRSSNPRTFWALVGLAAAFGLAGLIGNRVGWERLEIGYRTVPSPSGLDIGVAGQVITGLPSLCIALALVTVVTALIIRGGRRFRSRLPLPVTAGILWVLLAGLLVLFYPSTLAFQWENHRGAAEIDFYVLQDRPGPFQGTAQKSQRLTYYRDCGGTGQAACPVFECVVERRSWLGGLQKIEGFYPGLDQERQLELLRTRCLPGTP
ncbi:MULTISPECIES: hypothetical protein [Pseudomonas]|uniref:Uncharacterized protein n=1 Tax=Pseudomonas oryzihabitans TaxID=47885 RepID=A0A178LB75_9PSED|nr:MULTISPECIES: hypothetical protein [Pseudomonas]OAN26082.1 hypothetical protein A4V15_06705 [Pseudomonas oryzihabitans]SEO92591.1 hypothetical protein SAMN02787149_102465 [Pseudomonas sp. Snoq117.2]